MPGAPELDKRILRQALQRFIDAPTGDSWDAEDAAPFLIAAARFALPLLPEKCGTCGGLGRVGENAVGASVPCLFCGGSGLVFDPETVERIAQAMIHAVSQGGLDSHIMALAVLAALNSPTPEEGNPPKDPWDYDP